MTAFSPPPAAHAVVIRALRPGEDSAPFRILNEEWITRHFVLEPHDIEVLTNPTIEILDKGGHIYLAEAHSDIVGCVALIPLVDSAGASTGSYELSKMAVSPALRGGGIGRLLIAHTIAEARRLGAKSLFLGSSKKLENAVHLYESMGFQHVPPSSLPGINYSRADVFMSLTL